MKKITAITIAIIFASTTSFAQDPRNSDIKVNAKVDAGCFLDAENINFSVLQMPLQDQSALGEIRIKCSKNANLQLNINYNSNSISQPSGSGTTMEYLFSLDNANYYVVKYSAEDKIAFNKINTETDTYACYPSGFLSANNPYIGLNGCVLKNGNYVPNIWEGDYNSSNILMVNGGYQSGSLVGISSAEQIKFIIENPLNNQSWTNNNKHNFVATGDNQFIPMKASIKRADNVTHRMTPDTYQSTIVVVLTY